MVAARHRVLGMAVALTTLFALLAPAAQNAFAATTVSSYVDGRFGDVSLSVIGDGLGNDIRVDLDAAGDAFTISDSRPIEIGDAFDERCELVAPNRARCEVALETDWIQIEGGPGADEVRLGREVRPEGASINVEGGPGPDEVRLAREVPAAALYGGGGRDVLVGGNDADVVVGNRGNDVERGRGGSDEVGINYEIGTPRHDPGRDKLFGGRDDDVLRADDDQRDKRIRCGRGNDMALKDARIDPRPRSCEEIRRRP